MALAMALAMSARFIPASFACFRALAMRPSISFRRGFLTAIFARGTYWYYMSTETWRARRWRLFSTDPLRKAWSWPCPSWSLCFPWTLPVRSSRKVPHGKGGKLLFDYLTDRPARAKNTCNVAWEIAPSRRMRISGSTCRTVDGCPPGVEPPSKIRSISGPS